MNLQQIAVASVQQRGFHRPHNIPELARYPLLAAQILRLAEESGELAGAIANGVWPDEIGDEAADVMIVAFQIAHLTGQTVQRLRPGLDGDYLRPESLGLLGLQAGRAVGELCRAIRKNQPALIDANLGLLWLTLSRLVVAAGAGELADCILAKLPRDEERGELHGEPAPDAVGTNGNGSGGDLQLSDLGGEHNVYTDGPIFSGGATISAGALRDVPLNYRIWQSEEPGQYSHNGQGAG